MESITGPYDFDESPHSLFWNRAYGLLSRVCSNAHSLKNICIQRNVSPIVFSNILPVPIPNELRGAAKTAQRKLVSDQVIVEHLKEMFNMPICQRISVVILSVGSLSEFDHGKKVLSKLCLDRRIAMFELPYLGSRVSNSAVDDAMDSSHRSAVCQIVSLFLSKDV